MSKLKSTTSKTLRLFLHYIWINRNYAIGILIGLPITIFAEQYFNTIIIANVLGRLAKGNFDPHRIWHEFGGSIIAYAVSMLIGSVGWRVVDSLNWRLEGKVESSLTQHVYSHLIDQSANFHANTFSGSLVSQTSKLMSSYVRFADTTVYQVLQLVFGLIFTVIILAPRAPLFVVLLLIFVLGYMVSGVFVTRKVRILTAKLAASESVQTGYLADSVSNIMAIKSFAGGRHERNNYKKIAEGVHGNLIDVANASQRQMAYFSIMNRIILVMALVMAIVGVAVFKSNIATVFLIFSYTASLVSQLWNFCNNSLKTYNRAFGDAADMTEILEIEPEIKDPISPEKSRITDGSIEFRDVEFTHDGVDESLFEKLNIRIAAGEKIGLVGHSGSGKTTLTRLLLRFSDVDGGEILIDDQNITHITQDDLHEKIGYVPQEPIMFHRSLQDNIRYGRFSASDEEIVKAAKVAHADEFIKRLPDGYETLVGERGVKLSGGQRQRIAIARAMIKNAPILVLDEATSALDSESEILIQDALWKLMEGRTAIVIAHRLSTIQKMDRIVVLEDGQIVEEGTHAQLMKSKGVYAKLWEHQSGGFIEE
jgi:ATP-binding cassette subfamily B protein